MKFGPRSMHPASSSAPILAQRRSYYVLLLFSLIPSIVLSIAALMPTAALANAPSLQVNPLQYEDTLSGNVKNGYVDVANPSDAPVDVEAKVQAFKQVGTNGDLSFYDDPDIAAAIKLDLSSITLAPHDAVRVLFSVDPAKLPAGGTYAAIFFRTIPRDNAGSHSSYVAESANIGTLLILRNGGLVPPSGGLSGLNLGFWQFGHGISGSAMVTNAASPHGGVAFRPELSARVLWGKAAAGQGTGLVLPGSRRQFAVSRPGSFLGPLPVTVTDAATHTSRTAWVFACTGLAGWWLLVLLLALAVLIILRATRRLRLPRVSFRPLLQIFGRLRRRPRPARPARAMDSLGPGHSGPALPRPVPLPVPPPVPETVVEPSKTALKVHAKAAADPAPPEPEPAPEPLPQADPAVTKVMVKAEAAAPDPGTVVMPEPDATPAKPPAKVRIKPKSKPAHKVKLQVDDKPEKAAPKPPAKAAHKVKVKPDTKPKAKPKPKPKAKRKPRT